MIEGLKVVKAFTHEEKAKEEFKKLNETYRDAAQKANYYSTMIMPVSGNLMNISYALTAAFGGVLSIVMGLRLGSSRALTWADWWSTSTTPSRWVSPSTRSPSR